MNTVPSSYDTTTTAVSRPVDRVRWASIFAGLFTAISALVVLTLIGLAIGLSSYQPGTRAADLGIGAGIWGAISALIAFAIGGWIAARTAAVAGRNNGLLNGSMVWLVAIPLFLYLLGSGLGTIATTASNAAPALANNPNLTVPGGTTGTNGATGQTGTTGQSGASGANAANGANGAQNAPSSADVQNAAKTASSAIWGTLLWIVLGFIAAAVGGMLGARPSVAEVAAAEQQRMRQNAQHGTSGHD